MNRSRKRRLACEKHVDGTCGRPSLAIAHTTSDAPPRCASPQTNTPGVRVCHPTSHSILPSGSVPTSRSVSSGGAVSTPSKPRASRTISHTRSVVSPVSTRVRCPSFARDTQPEPSGLRGPHPHRRREIPAPPIGIVCHCPPHPPARCAGPAATTAMGRDLDRGVPEVGRGSPIPSPRGRLGDAPCRAVGGRVAATDDHDVLTSRRDARRTITLAFVVGRTQVRHRTMDSAKTTTRYVGVSGTISPDRQDYRLEIRREVVRAHVHSDGAVSDESGPPLAVSWSSRRLMRPWAT